MSGTINLAFTQQFDMDGRPLSGGFLYFYAAGTSTPQNAFQDTALTIVLPNPIVLDASGRVPMFYLADGFIKIRLTDEAGLVIIAADQLLVIGPSSGGGGGGGGAVDAAAILQTGDIKARYGEGTLTGFVRCNGKSIGNATSGGTEGFGDTMNALFEYLWQFSNITLNTAKGANAHADWVAGRQLNLPDLRGRTIAGTDDMGSTAASRLTAAGLGVAATTLGNAGAAETATLATANLPDHVHTGSTNTDGQHAHTLGTANTTGAHSHSLSGGSATQGASASLGGDHGHSVNESAHHHTVNDATNHAAGGFSGGGSGWSGTATVNTSDVSTGIAIVAGGAHAHALSGSTSNDGDHSHALTIPSNSGSNHAHAFSTSGTTGATATAISKTQPTMVLTYYIKL